MVPKSCLLPLLLAVIVHGLLLSACYDDPHKKYVLKPPVPANSASGEDLSFGDTVVAYLRGGAADSEFILGVEFAPGSSLPEMETIGDVEALLVILRDFPGVSVVIEGHTDSAGDPQKNLRLSQWRAQWVQNFLLDRGIAPQRVAAEGFGDTVPIADNSTQRGQEKNRRLVVRLEKGEAAAIGAGQKSATIRAGKEAAPEQKPRGALAGGSVETE
ncbi:peptidoglycan-associated lipoprotein [Microbulbifer aestuariivivens]|uniref:Peptidoglycan-associated lipoprotein n=1 Tax=Microbulbifer aestuariivivens TaxID=1908308 RepID=A0ABP9WPY2_9GAMM